MSRSRFVFPLLVAAVVFTGGADLIHQARTRGSMRVLHPPAAPSQLAQLIPSPLLPPPPPPPPPPAGEPFLP